MRRSDSALSCTLRSDLRLVAEPSGDLVTIGFAQRAIRRGTFRKTPTLRLDRKGGFDLPLKSSDYVNVFLGQDTRDM